MSRDKQIDESIDLVEIIYMSGYGLYRMDCLDIAKQIQEQGYRKASDVAREILEDFDKHGVYSKDYTDFLRKEYGIKENTENED